MRSRYAPRTDGLPAFITFTGVDDRTSFDGMAELSASFPIEWAVLLSPKRQGLEPRYPGEPTLSRFVWADHLRKAAHLCGGHARNVIERQATLSPVDLSYFDRVQVNHAHPKPHLVAGFVAGWGDGRGIAQSRLATFPTDRAVDWLFDPSGGRGHAPNGWPPHPGGDRFVGYSGGISPENVAGVVAGLRGPGPYWIDMESGVRTDDWLDLGKCRAVCEAVYGKADTYD